jgi:hypothetical protein
MATQDRGVTVRLLVFSGRPDPEWTLGPGEAEELAALVRQGRGGEKAGAVRRERLGYRGFLVRSGGALADLPAEIVVTDGVVTENPGPREVNRRDTAGLEQALLRQATERGYGEVLAALGRSPGGQERPS